eukprot:GHVU01212350.1.p1 GENE.GHVU01212350.1~~GHVU01212350.1.p1  ORF type:complete len:888 (+),score=186.99 GHVU01212350.1:619-3282(+)
MMTQGETSLGSPSGGGPGRGEGESVEGAPPHPRGIADMGLLTESGQLNDPSEGLFLSPGRLLLKLQPKDDAGGGETEAEEEVVQFEGVGFGFRRGAAGEAVFSTGMVGYPESLTDPSYAGQVLVLTFPLIGNYGVADETAIDENGLSKHFESSKVHVEALVVSDYSEAHSHYLAKTSLARWLHAHRVPALTGVDTRAVVQLLRTRGTLSAKVIFDDLEPAAIRSLAFPRLTDVPPEDAVDLVQRVSRSEPTNYSSKPQSPLNTKPIRIVVVDCGIKQNIIRNFLYHLPYNLQLKVVPYRYPFGDEEEMDALFLSNGPGDPQQCTTTIENIRKVMQRGKAIFGICLGNQLLALAAGAKTYKMKFGNRGHNVPVVDLRNTRCVITAQNHGYAVDADSLSAEWMPIFVNANDGSNEGIRHKTMPWFSVQFHPEARGGPTDSFALLHDFITSVLNPGWQRASLVPFAVGRAYRRLCVLGSGGLSIGQAGEFDYSGSQAIKALKELRVHVTLVNPNIATVQTSQRLADRVYFLPVTPEFVSRVIEKEACEALLCTFGGQTALNCAVDLHNSGALQRLGCHVLGTPIEAIIKTEDRQIFAETLAGIGERCCPSVIATQLDQCREAGRSIGFPLLVRAAYALGGLGSGFAGDEDELLGLCEEAFRNSKQVIIDKSLRGWKEVEYEVMRDSKDNCVTICNMENFDPLGIHTGDSIVVAPSQTLSNDEYHMLREASLKVIRHLGIVGECNVQFALDPHSSQYFIVEVNARLSRSSALASKATGYPIAYVAAKLAMGSDLLRERNTVTLSTTACFEPALDYVVVKVPRWDLKKFSTAEKRLGPAMRSVGEVMGIGRNFEEAFQKTLRMPSYLPLRPSTCLSGGFCYWFAPYPFKLDR